MTLQEKISIAIQIITLVGIAFSVYLFIRKPQERSEITDAVFAEQFKNLASNFDTRFQDMKDGVVKIMQNDLQEVKSDVREHARNQIIYERENTAALSKLTTILEERLPRK
jgi:hypothetical protein